MPLTQPVTTERLQDLIASRPAGGVLARGAGLSYGDAAKNAGGEVLGTLTAPGVDLDAERGTATVTASTTFAQLLTALVPAGFIPPVLSLSREATVGGAIAADAHGPDHVTGGSISAWLEQIDLVDGTGELRQLTPAGDPEGLRATAGGLGLTGVIVTATVRLRRLETAGLQVVSRRAGSLCEVLSALEAAPTQYAVAWVDAAASGAALGRGVVEAADHVTAGELASWPPEAGRRARLAYQPPRSWRWPAPPVPVTPATVRAFNTIWYRRAPARHIGLRDLAGYFHRLDSADGWNRSAGPAALRRYQFVVPDQAERLLEDILDAVRRHGCPPFLGRLQRLGAASGGELSFPRPGWCLAVDLPAGRPQVPGLLRALDQRIAAAGGRVRIAEDARLSRDAFEAMYGPLTSWRAARARLDPCGVFRSDLGRRVGLC